MLNSFEKELLLQYAPIFMADRAETIPILRLGCTVFEQAGMSPSFRDLCLDPDSLDAKYILEYAVYFDYDIQHLYDLEHAWVAVGKDGSLLDCWSTFHGMRVHSGALPTLYSKQGTHPVLYVQPGKHALMAHPELFLLHNQFFTCCRETAGGGLLIPPFLRGIMTTTPEEDEKIRLYIREHLTFTPTQEYVPAEVKEEQFICWPELLELIPQYVAAQKKIILGG